MTSCHRLFFFIHSCYFAGMLIKVLSAEKYTLKLREPFSYHTLTLNSLPYVLIRVTTDTGLVGIGEAALAWDVTGETQAGALAAIKLIEPLIIGVNLLEVDDVKTLMMDVEAYLAGNTGLKAAVESALFDVLGQKEGKPIFELLGGKKKPFILLQKTFSFEEMSDDPENIIQKAQTQGVNIFKFKVGGNISAEANKLKTISELFPGINIVIDANQAWDSPAQVLIFLEMLGSVKIGWLEQPLHAHDYDGLATLRKKTQIPIMVDESCHNLWHLKILNEKKALDSVNIKLSKCGGLLEAKRMIDYCDTHGLKYMLGDMIQSDVGTAYNLHAACLGDFVSYDLTLPSRFHSSEVSGLSWDGYRVEVPTKQGLGVTC